MSYQSALQTLQWSTCLDLENGVIYEDCLNFEPSKELEQRLLTDWENFQDQAIDDPQKRKPDISKAKQCLSWSPKIDLKTGLIKTIKYFDKVL